MNSLPPILPEELIVQLVERTLAEDLGGGDITSMAIVDSASESTGSIRAEAYGVLAGINLAKAVFRSIHLDLNFHSAISDSDRVVPDAVICTVQGKSRAILAGERTALSFLQHLSGIATLTSRFCDLVKSSAVQIAATRKTTPGLRDLEKWAVAIGGGIPHRKNLNDGVLIKDNHLALCDGDVTLACRQARERTDPSLQIEVEIDSLDQLHAALDGGADIILLDNMTVDDVRLAVTIVEGKAKLEVSGGITLENVSEYASAGPDIIAIGALTQSAPAFPMSLDLIAWGRNL